MCRKRVSVPVLREGIGAHDANFVLVQQQHFKLGQNGRPGEFREAGVSQTIVGQVE